MSVDILDLEAFYASPFGQMVSRDLSDGLSRLKAPHRHAAKIGLGYALPFEAQMGTNFPQLMPAEQGCIRARLGQSNRVALVDGDDLPLRDGSVDWILATHFFEHVSNISTALEEIWRVLSPEGRLIMVVPNRRGLWARLDKTPFGMGRPYSRGQLRRAAMEVGFIPLHWETGLHFLPSERRSIMRVSAISGPIMRFLLPELSGALILELAKRVSAPIKARRSILPVSVASARSATASFHYDE